MSTLQTLPVPVTANPARARTNVDRSIVSIFVAFCNGLVALSSNQPKAALLFIGAGVVVIGLYIMVPPMENENEEKYPIMVSCLKRLPDVFSAASYILVMIGISFMFQHEVALIAPLFSFISFVVLAALFGTIVPAWVTVGLYGVGLVSLLVFVVLACTP